jgi:hypothetical protein
MLPVSCLSKVLYRRATLRHFIISLALLVCALAAVNTLTFPLSVPYLLRLSGGTPMLDTRFWYDADTVHTVLAAFGAEGRHAYGLFLSTLDVLIPPAYSYVLMLALSLALKNKVAENSPWRSLNLLPLAAGLADYCENAITGTMLVSYPAKLPVLAGMAGYVTAVKFSVSVLSLFLAILVGFWPKPSSNQLASPPHKS